MQIVTSWMEQGIRQGIEREKSFILRQLTQQVGEVSDATKVKISNLDLTQLEDLGVALLDFSQLADLEAWLEEHR